MRADWRATREGSELQLQRTTASAFLDPQRESLLAGFQRNAQHRRRRLMARVHPCSAASCKRRRLDRSMASTQPSTALQDPERNACSITHAAGPERTTSTRFMSMPQAARAGAYG
jgi:hypothetical protein